MSERDELWDGLREHACELHAQRVAKTPLRIAYAEEQLSARGIKYEIKNREIGHFHCFRKSDGKMFQFWAGTGKIQGFENKRGIHALIRLVSEHV